ncbi:hypothetical protein BD410DRAFT_699959, partial [Rickenella mellea]
LSAVLQRGWAESTLALYSSALKRFSDFCDKENVPILARLPASEYLLCVYAASFAGIFARSSVQNLLSAVRAWHIVEGAHWHGGVRLVYVLNGLDSFAPASSKRPARVPVTRAMLDMLYDRLSLSDPFDVCVLACATVAFWSQSRLGELLSHSRVSFHATKIPRRLDLANPSTTNGSRVLRYPWTKTKRSKGDTVLITRQIGRCDPISALANHLSINYIPDEYPLFSYRTTSSQLSFLTKSDFMGRCNAIWCAAGFPPSSGHAFRIGGTTELLLSGVPPDVVKTMGRWSSDSFLRYWR